MNGLQELTNSVLSLPINERALLAQELWESIEYSMDSVIETAWLGVADKRWQDIREKKVNTVTAEDALQKVRAILSNEYSSASGRIIRNV